MDTLANWGKELAISHFSLEEKMGRLKRKVEQLHHQEADVIAMLREAELHPGKRRKSVVQHWLADAAGKQNEFSILEREVREISSYSRLNLAARADKMIEEVTELVDQGTFPDSIVLHVDETANEQFLMAECQDQAFEENFRKLWAWLTDNEVSKIGIYGMGGVGKTTLAQHVYNKLKRECMFDGNIFWCTVSGDLNVYKLQNDISKALNLDLSGEDDEDKRAAKLGRALERRKRFVLMLDDVWTPFCTQKIGISDTMPGHKIIVSSRSLEVCRKMECQENLKVEGLSEEEAWKLFMNKLGRGTQLPSQLEAMAKKVARECDGLPLAIITMAGSLRGVSDIHEWRDALAELKESCMEREDMGNEVYPILLCSYNRLRYPKLHRCFLYCSLYPEDHFIPRDELIQRLISEGVMDRRRSRQAEFDQGHAILNKLENVCLLERNKVSMHVHGVPVESVKMHDLIRDMALRINKGKFMVKAGLSLREIPDAQEWEEDLEKVSLMKNSLGQIPRGICVPNVPKLSTLILWCNYGLKSIPDSLFAQMPGLRILDLSRTGIWNLPNSICDLEKLNALLLSHCLELTTLPAVGKLKELRELDLNSSGVKELPQGRESLTNLRRLDIDCENMKILPQGFLSRLTKLQHLKLPLVTNVASMEEELRGLEQLEEIKCNFWNMADFNKFMMSWQGDEQLNRYEIVIGSNISPCSFDRLYSRWMMVGEDTYEKGERDKVDIIFPRNVEYLVFRNSGAVGSCLFDNVPQLSNCVNLKKCQIESEDAVEYIIGLPSSEEERGEEHSPWVPFTSLESLKLSGLPNFISILFEREGVAVAPLPPDMFSCLKVLTIHYCSKMKKLFPRSLAQNLHRLQELSIKCCSEMEEIIGDDGDTRAANVTWPSLMQLTLSDLPELKSICKGTLTCDTIRTIVINNCRNLKKMPLFLLPDGGHPSLKSIRIGTSGREREWWESLEWCHPNATNVLQPFIIREYDSYAAFDLLIRRR